MKYLCRPLFRCTLLVLAMCCLTTLQAQGIDVSKFQGTIDWKKVRNVGVRFVIIRVGYAALASGTLNSDYMYAKNIKGAYNAGINVGIC